MRLSVQQSLINKPLKCNRPTISPNLGLNLQTKTHQLFKWYLMHRPLVQAVRDFYKRMMGRITGDRRRIRGTKYKTERQGQSERERGAKWGGVHPGLVHSFTAHLYSEGKTWRITTLLKIHCHLQMNNLVHTVAEYLHSDICISVCTHQVRCMFDVQADLRTHKHVDTDMDPYYIQSSAQPSEWRMSARQFQ